MQFWLCLCLAAVEGLCEPIGLGLVTPAPSIVVVGITRWVLMMGLSGEAQDGWLGRTCDVDSFKARL